MTDIERVKSRITSGDRLHMQFVDGRRVWWFEQPHWVVRESVIARLLSDPHSPLREAGDSLFGFPLNSQTFLSEAPMAERTYCTFPECNCSSGAAERCAHPPLSLAGSPAGQVSGNTQGEVPFPSFVVDQAGGTFTQIATATATATDPEKLRNGIVDG